MTGHSSIEVQVGEFFAERGLLPLVPARVRPGAKPKVHAAFPHSPYTPLCTRARKRGSVMRSADMADLVAPPCRACTTQHIWILKHYTSEDF